MVGVPAVLTPTDLNHFSTAPLIALGMPIPFGVSVSATRDAIPLGKDSIRRSTVRAPPRSVSRPALFLQLSCRNDSVASGGLTRKLTTCHTTLLRGPQAFR